MKNSYFNTPRRSEDCISPEVLQAQQRLTDLAQAEGYVPAMRGADVRKIQRTLQLKNLQLCEKLGVTEATLCNYKANRQKVPQSIQLALLFLLTRLDHVNAS